MSRVKYFRGKQFSFRVIFSFSFRPVKTLSRDFVCVCVCVFEKRSTDFSSTRLSIAVVIVVVVDSPYYTIVKIILILKKLAQFLCVNSYTTRYLTYVVKYFESFFSLRPETFATNGGRGIDYILLGGAHYGYEMYTKLEIHSVFE